MSRHAIVQWGTDRAYLLHHLLPEAEIVDLKLNRRLAAGAIRGRNVWLHINLSHTSRVPANREALLQDLERNGQAILNRACVDVRKRSVQARLAAAGLNSVVADWTGRNDELLIIKSNGNYGALMERRLSQRTRARLRLPHVVDGIRTSKDYRIVPRSAVPKTLWTDQDIAIERFIRNREGGFLRGYRCGPFWVISEAWSRHEIKKLDGGVMRRNHLWREGTAWPSRLSGDLRRELVAAADAMGLNYGTIDIVHDDAARPYVVDVNPTPYWGEETQEQMLVHLREGALSAPWRQRNARRQP